MTGSELYRRAMAIYAEQGEERDLMHLLWSGTPWMVDAYVGLTGDKRRVAVRQWCCSHYGPEASPLDCHPGAWFGGLNTINGWAWFGFATEPMMTDFIEVWPVPDDATPLLEIFQSNGRPKTASGSPPE